MRFAWGSPLALGAAIGLLGAVLLITPAGFDVEEEIGLSALFRLRGTRPAPQDVVLVSVDKRSAEELCVIGRYPDRLCTGGKWWPRAAHARLVDQLTAAGASVIVFDLLFDVPRDEDDDVLSAALARSGRVALVEYLKREELSLGSAKASKETLVPPIAQVRKTAIATAPFALPKMPVRVNSYTPFPPNAGEPAALPVAAFQLHSLRAYAALYEACAAAADGRLPKPPAQADRFRTDFQELIDGLRRLITREPEISDALRLCARRSNTVEPRIVRTIDSLLDIYAHDGSRHFDLYGPPQTITTISYVDALALSADAGARARFSGKAIFIGVSDVSQPEQKDSYYTVFSRADGVDINGVELAATAFANLLENRALRWDYSLTLACAMAWGVVCGLIARRLATPRAALAIAALGAVYLAGAHSQFADSALWLPLAVPLLLQAPAAFALGALGQYRKVSAEKDNIRQAFGHFLPAEVVDELAQDVKRIPGHSQALTGTCLYTDIAGYTGIAEKLDPAALRALLNSYYGELFAPVETHHGLVSDIVGDAMVAIWAAATDSPSLRASACRAALDIAAATERFGRSPGHPALPTRMGLESGRVALGNVGGIGHYEYRAVGDIVNTASRLQELNKTLGTRVLASSEVLRDLPGFCSRLLGEFRLPGKSESVRVLELLGLEPEITDEQRMLCGLFAEAIAAVQAKRWEEARMSFLALLDRYPTDGPSLFYADLLKREHHLAGGWDGIVVLNTE